MGDTKHTPGPWRVVGPITRKGFRLPQPSIADASGRCVIHWGGFDGLERSKQEMRANQRLIAAAPELLEACRAALAEHGRSVLFGSVALDLLERAIAKAGGHHG